MRQAIVAACLIGAMVALGAPWQARADETQVARGRYLVGIGGCNDCHTPGYFLGKPDASRYLGGSDVGFEIPGLGVFVGPNLTPDKETGLGGWSEDEIVTAIQTGVRPDGRILAPIMPWRALAGLTKEDARAVAAYLKSIPPVVHKAPGPFGASEKPSVFVMRLVPP
jgi:mono/diheme cytochrome c family protein